MIIDLNELKHIKENNPGKRIVLSSGTFDLFHANHLSYLNKVKEFGDVLVVVVASDKRTSASKGEKRPIFPQQDRAEIVNGLKVVDYVFIDTGEKANGELDQAFADVFDTLRPDVFVTANDEWRNYQQIMGGAELVILPRVTGGRYGSTSEIIEYISNS